MYDLLYYIHPYLYSIAFLIIQTSTFDIEILFTLKKTHKHIQHSNQWLVEKRPAHTNLTDMKASYCQSIAMILEDII